MTKTLIALAIGFASMAQSLFAGDLAYKCTAFHVGNDLDMQTLEILAHVELKEAVIKVTLKNGSSQDHKMNYKSALGHSEFTVKDPSEGEMKVFLDRGADPNEYFAMAIVPTDQGLSPSTFMCEKLTK